MLDAGGPEEELEVRVVRVRGGELGQLVDVADQDLADLAHADVAHLVVVPGARHQRAGLVQVTAVEVGLGGLELRVGRARVAADLDVAQDAQDLHEGAGHCGVSRD
ncbi:hypothetical protein, partial [Crossiella equi]|uniref:hypothetical protein n=1 Tax=Crossiella equi TaxID=130796 RepID=UPI001178A627